MKQFLTLLMVGAGLLFSSVFSSCDNSLTYEPNPNDSIQVQLVKTPDVVAYSGEQVWGSTFGTKTAYSTRSNNSSLTKWQWDSIIEGWPEKTDRDQAVSTDELNYVMEYLSKHPNEGYTECDLTTYFLQLVGKSHVRYHEPFIDDNGDVHHYADIDGSSQMDYFEINGIHINDYNGDAGPWIYVENLPLINPRYHDSYNNLTQENHYRFYYIPNEDGNGYSLYLCFDYATSKYDNGQLDFEGDGVYNDWVIKIIPANGIVTPPNGTNPPAEPTDVTEHVEVNLSIEDHSNIDNLISHLSIHVRAITDVEIFIPIPKDYYCDTDDMEIVGKHDKFFVYGGPSITEYNINGSIVTLTVSFEENGIRITTDNIDENVISYLQETYNDGITFEVWNYFNEDIDVETLKEYLNQSTIKFLDKTPDLYVNAFNDTENGDKFENDCIVSIVDEQVNEYPNNKTDYWYNNSEYNELYSKNPFNE